MVYHGGVTVWFTGLSGAGKSTLAQRLREELIHRGRKVELLDGDVVRTNLSKGLGFSKEDRDTNIRRIAFVCDLLTRNGVIVLAAAISPYRAIRGEARQTIGNFVEVFVDCPLEELVRRDSKGLYAKALRGEITNFTGVSDPYEPPQHPEIVVYTDRESVEESLGKILAKLEELGHISPTIPGLLGPILPHGGVLVNRVAPPVEWRELQAQAAEMPRIFLGSRELSDLLLIGVGAFSPLMGFMGARDYMAVVQGMHIANGLPWTIPVTLPVVQETTGYLNEGQNVALTTSEGRVVATMELQEMFTRDKLLEAQEVYRTTDQAHPGVAALNSQSDLLAAGPVTIIDDLELPEFQGYWLPPAETRKTFMERGWSRIVGFQTRNPVHRAHEYIQKCALEITDGLLLHPLVGETKGDDTPAETRMQSYRALLSGYYPEERVLLSVLPAAMRYAGPREAIFHAIVRKNFGCTHFIVGRDHAGVGNYYGTYDAHEIFKEFQPEELGITPLFFDHSFYCRRCGGMASAKTCPHDPQEHVTLSGTLVREMLQRGELPPPEFSRPEVARTLMKHP